MLRYIVVTGHSLGGALLAIFPCILFLHDEKDILNSFAGVLSYGQPRIGDNKFGSFIDEKVLHSELKKKFCYRVVYGNDLIPRVPFDDPICQFKHFGHCIYFSSWYKGQMIEEEPTKNYFNPIYLPSNYFNAFKDLTMALFLSETRGKYFKESWASIMSWVPGYQRFPSLA